MQVEGITWHAVTLKGDAFDETKKLVSDVLGLSPMFEQPGVSVFSTQNGTLLELYTPEGVPSYGYTVTSHSVSVSTTSRLLLRSWPTPDMSCWARSPGSKR